MTGLSADIGRLGLVVVHDFDVRWAGGGPAKADAVLIVDPDTVLTGAITLESLQAISGRHAQVIEPPGDLELAQLASRHGGDVREASGAAAAGECLRVGIAERDDHRE